MMADAVGDDGDGGDVVAGDGEGAGASAGTGDAWEGEDTPAPLRDDNDELWGGCTTGGQ